MRAPPDPDDVIDEIGMRIAELRRAREWTQSEVADRMGVPLRNYQRYEAGNNLTIRTLVAIAAALGVRPVTLWQEPTRVVRRRGRPKRDDERRG